MIQVTALCETMQISQVLMVMSTNMTVIWDAALCSPVEVY